MTTEIDDRPVPSEGDAYCDRCKAMTPIEEWRLIENGKVWLHCGSDRSLPRAAPGLKVTCGFQIRIPAGYRHGAP